MFSFCFQHCHLCRKGDNEELLLVCHGCYKGCHTYCHRPKIPSVPDGKWLCHICVAKVILRLFSLVFNLIQSPSPQAVQLNKPPSVQLSNDSFIVPHVHIHVWLLTSRFYVPSFRRTLNYSRVGRNKTELWGEESEAGTSLTAVGPVPKKPNWPNTTEIGWKCAGKYERILTAWIENRIYFISLL